MPGSLSGSLQGQNRFHKNTEMLFALLTGWTFAPVVQEQGWVNLLALEHESGCDALMVKQTNRKKTEEETVIM